jgi:hypothetical protein
MRGPDDGYIYIIGFTKHNQIKIGHTKRRIEYRLNDYGADAYILAAMKVRSCIELEEGILYEMRQRFPSPNNGEKFDVPDPYAATSFVMEYCMNKNKTYGSGITP